jgi:SAM-dependent methyltransferase
MNDILRYGTEDFARALDANESERGTIAEEVAKYDFAYRTLDQSERDSVILNVLQRLDSFTKVGAHRDDIWESHWSESKLRFLDSGGDLSALDPTFTGAHSVIRLHGDYARPDSAQFERRWFRVMRRWLFERYLPGAKCLFEFGCGSGFNLAAAAQLFPELTLVGLDWSSSAVGIVEEIARMHGFNLKGARFDFFNPDHDMSLGRDTVVTTFAALEQTGAHFVTFAEWLLERRPRLVLSVEPILDFYDPDRLFDYLAIRYHTHRDYLNGYLGWVRAKAKAGDVEILASLRPGFGSLYHEGYSVLAWRPV